MTQKEQGQTGAEELLQETPEVMWLALSGREIPTVTGGGLPLQLCGGLDSGQSSPLDRPLKNWEYCRVTSPD